MRNREQLVAIATQYGSSSAVRNMLQAFGKIPVPDHRTLIHQKKSLPKIRRRP